MIDLSSISFSQLLSIKERLSTRYNGAPNKALFEQLCNVQDAINTKEPTNRTEVIQKLLGMVRGDEDDQAVLTFQKQAGKVLTQLEGVSL